MPGANFNRDTILDTRYNFTMVRLSENPCTIVLTFTPPNSIWIDVSGENFKAFTSNNSGIK
jgi:hypothetical protein